MGDFLFPEGDAAAIRTLSLARICRDLGHAVTVVGKGSVRAEDYHAESDGHYVEGIRYSTLNPAPVSTRDRLRHPIRRITQFQSALERLDLRDTAAVVLNASGSARHVPFVMSFCRRRSIPFVADVCEWYDPRQMTYGRIDPEYAVFRLVFRYWLPRVRNVVAVSRLLERHFEGAGRNVLRVAPVLDTCGIACRDSTPADRLVLLYAGLPGRKDLLKVVFEALGLLAPEERSRIEFRLLGPTRAELAGLLGRSADLLDVLGATVKAVGRVPRPQVLEALQEAHFTVLLRPDERYANAGFPSKVPESLAAGTPLILNLTSDLGEYLPDGKAAIVVREPSAACVAEALRRALRMSAEERAGLRACARAKAEEHFDYRRHAGSFASFLERVH